jgi:DNA polymerase V
MLCELVEEAGVQEDLFQAAAGQAPDNGRSERLMAVMDAINRRSRATVYMAREVGPAAYAMRRGHLSPAYTTSWDELPKVR